QAMNELSNGQTVRRGYPIGLERASPSASVRAPQPEYSRGPIRWAATGLAFASSTIPLHRRSPLLDASESTLLPSASSAIAKYPRSGSQKSRLKRRLGGTQSPRLDRGLRARPPPRSRSASAGSFQTTRASRAPRSLAS